MPGCLREAFPSENLLDSPQVALAERVRGRTCIIFVQSVSIVVAGRGWARLWLRCFFTLRFGSIRAD